MLSHFPSKSQILVSPDSAEDVDKTILPASFRPDHQGTGDSRKFLEISSRAAMNAKTTSLASLACSVLERILLSFSYEQEEAATRGATANYNLENCLSFAQQAIPDFLGHIRGKNVLDYGCGLGWQSVRMALSGAKSVTGFDLDEKRLNYARQLASASGASHNTNFISELPKEQFEVTVSLCSFEHFANPEQELRKMSDLTECNGYILIAFAEPWFSHSGSHMNDYIRIPWINLLFPERVVMQARRKYRQDGAQRYEAVVGGLNKMSVSRFERIIQRSGLKVVHKRLYPTLGIPLVIHVPVIRELLTSACACVLNK